MLDNKSVDCVVTSPPYWGLRDYGYSEQIGLEETPEMFIQNLVGLFETIKGKLKDTGTCFVNLGDTYAGSGNGTTKYADTDKYIENSKQVYVMPNGTAKSNSYRGTQMNKSLLMIPYRFAWAMVENGWILRNVINWRKPNQMPSSAKDRFTVDFEPIFFFVKKATDYNFEQQLEPYTKPLDRWGGDNLEANGTSTWDDGTGQKSYRNRNMRPNPEGRNMRTTWDINTESFPEAHFAVYPKELCMRMIKAGCPENGLVLDPFMGSGTTAVCSRILNRNYVGFELNKEYIDISQKRIFNELGMFA